MNNLDVFPGFDLEKFKEFLAKAATDDHTWDCLRLMGLSSTDVIRLRPYLISHLKQTRWGDSGCCSCSSHRWNSLVISWIIPSPEFLELLIEIIHLNVFQSVYFKCPSESTPTLPMGLGRQMPLALVRVCLESSIVQRLTVSHVTIDHETAALFQEQSKFDGGGPKGLPSPYNQRPQVLKLPQEVSLNE
jgi:hypothetical protein